MLAKSINDMSFDELRIMLSQKIQELDELNEEFFKFKKNINDLIYNLDDDNLSSRLKLEKDNMKSELYITPERIKTAVSKGIDFFDAIRLSEHPNETTKKLDTEKIYVYTTTGNTKDDKYFYYNTLSKKWEQVSDAGIYSVFEQTDDGFYLKGNVIIDGSRVTVQNITFDASANPVKVLYSVNQSEWHTDYNASSDSFMKMSIDGGASYGQAIRINARDGENGIDGSDAKVTAKNVFEAIMSSTGNEQGLFSAFYESENKLFINAEYIRAGTIAGMTFTDADGKICSLTLDNKAVKDNTITDVDNTDKTHKNRANMTLTSFNKDSADDTEREFFSVADIYSNNTHQTYIILQNHKIGWGDTIAFNPTGTWNFQDASVEGLSKYYIFG